MSKPATTRLQVRPDNPCFGCGGANPRGMKLEFESDEARRRIIGRFRLGEEYQGGPGFLHGGIIATLLDEAMGKMNRFSGATAVTAELNVEYHRPVRVNEEIVVEAFEVKQEGRELFHESEIRNTAGDLLARGRGRFVSVDREGYRRRLAGDGNTKS
ncbi:MAG TPA: PaaI family thioesterase [Candidatus Acidoferrales bacterium]